MKRRPWLWMVLLLPAIVSATPEEAADRFVDLWNLDEPRAAHFAEVFNDDFVQRRSVASLDRMLSMLSNDNGDIAISEVNLSEAQRVVFAARSVADKWVEIALDLDAEFKIAGMQVRRMQAPLDPSQQGLSLSEIVKLLEIELDGKAARGEFSVTSGARTPLTQ